MSDQKRVVSTVRTGLIVYGIAAYGYLVSRPEPATGVATTYLLFGLGIQLLLIVARMFVKQRVSDHDMAAQALVILELIADAVTVALFALGTIGAVVRAPEEF